MDALEQYLGAGQPSSQITDELLDRLRSTESGGNPKAVNAKTGAQGAYQFMPGTVEMLKKQGINFDPFNEKQSREAARQYLGQLVDQNGGNLDKALAQYGGFKTQDPSAYIQKVKGAPQSSGDPLEDYLGGTAMAAAPTPAPAPLAASQRVSNVATQLQDQFAAQKQAQNPHKGDTNLDPGH